MYVPKRLEAWPWGIILVASLIEADVTQLKASAILYNQTLYTFGTSITVADNSTRSYHNYAWEYSLASSFTTTGDAKTISEVTFPNCITANAFSFSNSTRYPNILAFGQSDKEDLLDKRQLTSTFYSFNPFSNEWSPEPTLSANGPVRRTGASLVAFENKVIIFGGFITSPNYPVRLLTRQLFLYDDSKNRWIDLTQSAADANMAPSVFHSATIVDDRWMLVMGGAVDTEPPESKDVASLYRTANMSNLVKRDLSEVYIFDFLTGNWSIKNTLSASNRPRIAHTADYIPELNSIIVVGGTSKHTNGTIYDDAQLLDLNTWTWKEIVFKHADGREARVPRAWHASAVVGEQLFLMHSGMDSATDLDYRVINISNWTFTTQVLAAPLSKKFKYSLHPESPLGLPSLPPLPPPGAVFHNAKFILGSTLGAMSGAAAALLAALGFRKYRHWKSAKKLPDDFPTPSEPNPYHLTPIWSNSYSRFDNHSDPFISSLTDNAVWELDSQYAYSTHMNFFGSRPPPSGNPNGIYPGSTGDSVIQTRRWSSETERRSLKALTEVPPNSKITELFMTQSTIRQSWMSFGKFSAKSYHEVSKQDENEFSHDAETMLPSPETDHPKDTNSASLFSTLTSV